MKVWKYFRAIANMLLHVECFILLTFAFTAPKYLWIMMYESMVWCSSPQMIFNTSSVGGIWHWNVKCLKSVYVARGSILQMFFATMTPSNVYNSPAILMNQTNESKCRIFRWQKFVKTSFCNHFHQNKHIMIIIHFQNTNSTKHTNNQAQIMHIHKQK